MTTRLASLATETEPNAADPIDDGACPDCGTVAINVQGLLDCPDCGV